MPKTFNLFLLNVQNGVFFKAMYGESIPMPILIRAEETRRTLPFKTGNLMKGEETVN